MPCGNVSPYLGMLVALQLVGGLGGSLVTTLVSEEDQKLDTEDQGSASHRDT